jgi:hypothetical protein
MLPQRNFQSRCISLFQSGRLSRQAEIEGASLSNLAFHPDARAMNFDKAAAQVKAEPETTEVEEAEKAHAVAEAEAIANAKAEKPKHKAKRKAKEPVAVA